MTSLNFEFLRENYADLSELGAFAEQYVFSDPVSASIKLRLLIERMVNSIYAKTRFEKLPRATLNDLLIADSFKDVTPSEIENKFHGVKNNGNKAAHGDNISQQTAILNLQEAYDLARWFHLTYNNGRKEDYQSYQTPPSGGLAGASKARLKREKKQALEKISAQEIKLEATLKELEAVKEQASTYKVQLKNQATLLKKAQKSVDVLQFDEATTRKRLIDQQLADLGWKIGANGKNTDEVTQEEKLKYQPTKSGIGYADYVLWDDNGKPLAVIEAKKAAVSAETGKNQAEHYANGLEKEYGQRPVIFYSNGYDIWMWDDYKVNGRSNYPPRKLFGFYSKDSLQHLIYQRSAKKDLDTLSPRADIAGRLYQIESIKGVTEQFTKKRRKALIVQATGTGKTRVAIALTDLLIRASWVKRVLFLCDRRELRKQAKNAYNDFLNEPLVIVSKQTAKDRNKRIYLATYPAMSKIFQSFDVGFFDLIIADESHRSIYNVYGDIFKYFDCFQIGLTATPVEFVTRNTYELFECENQRPTSYYSFEQGVSQEYLTPYEVSTYTTDFLRKGIKYNQLSEEQRQEIEEKGEELDYLDFNAKDVDKNIYNKDTARHVIRNLMENGIKSACGQEVGKTIVFARNHNHAVLLQQIFDELYPQYGGKFCQVIDNYNPRAEQLIDDFKEANNELTIAVSVDMMDTGIDVPEVVNLVFAKPIHSKVKFWQMIGRGTRLCENLFGKDKHKMIFHIFDHWGNFDFFEFDYQEKQPGVSKSLTQILFENRIKLTKTCLHVADPDAFKLIAELIEKDVNRLPDESIAIRENWKTVKSIQQEGIIQQWTPVTVATLTQDIAPLMGWINIRGFSEAHRFDLLITQMQCALLEKSASFDDYKIILLEQVNNLQMNLNVVREKAAIIRDVRDNNYWQNTSVIKLEDLRLDIREIIHLQQKTITEKPEIDTIDITENQDGVEIDKRSSMLKSVDMKVYEQEVTETLITLFNKNITLQKIRKGEPVKPTELSTLTSLVLTQNANVDLSILQSFYDEATPLEHIIRTLVGMESEAVKTRFDEFAQKHPKLNTKQLKFLGLLQSHIAKYGLIEVDRLYEAPFTNIDADSIDGVFDDKSADELIDIIFSFSPSEAPL